MGDMCLLRRLCHRKWIDTVSATTYVSTFHFTGIGVFGLWVGLRSLGTTSAPITERSHPEYKGNRGTDRSHSSSR